MKVAFHTNTINYRGTTVAVTDYAKYNQEILGNESLILYNHSIGYEKDMGSEHHVVDELRKTFNVIGYSTGELSQVLETEHIDVSYFISAGQREPLPQVCKTAVHAVFQFNDPYGDRYAYISKWLSDTLTGGSTPYVPHIVQLPTPTSNYRQALGIDNNKTVIGRIGGYYTFDIQWVKDFVIRFVQEHDNFIFLFVGTEPFVNHPNVKFIDEIHSPQKKANFINTCDGMLHARNRGESFGLSIAEFLSLNKPVLAFNGGHDKNHIGMLSPFDTLYNNRDDLKEKLLDIKKLRGEWSTAVSEFTPNLVMQRFDKVFLK